MLVNFSVDKYNLNSVKNKNIIERLPLLTINEHGIVTNCDKDFIIDDLIFRKRKKAAVLNLCPYIPVDHNSETSCYATLLLHAPWPFDGEDKIVDDEVTAIDKLYYLMKNDVMPEYCLPLLQKVEKSEKLFEKKK